MTHQPGQGDGLPSTMRSVDDGKGVFEQLMQALNGILPMLDSMKETIEETTGKIPRASSQLASVTQATESATVEILNVLDAMTQNIDRGDAGLTSLEETYTLQTEKLRRIAALLASGTGPAAAEAAALAGESPAATTAVVESIRGALQQAKENSVNIAMALQVQDITSQQIAGVLHMIESVRLELARLLSQFGNGAHVVQLAPEVEAHAKTSGGFDTDAKFVPAGDRQERADKIIEQWNEPNHE